MLVALTLFFEDRQVVSKLVHEVWPLIFPVAALFALGGALVMAGVGLDARAFFYSSLMIAFLLIAGGIGQYPNLLISTTDAAYSLTTTNAAAADNTLQVTLIVAIIGMPFVLLYTSGAYYVFRGKVKLEPEGY